MVLAPKFARFKNDDCYSIKFDQLEQCNNCWIKDSCGAVYKSNLKKEAAAKKPKVIREKKYKKTDKHRDW